jgi:hypothetical protein
MTGVNGHGTAGGAVVCFDHQASGTQNTDDYRTRRVMVLPPDESADFLSRNPTGICELQNFYNFFLQPHVASAVPAVDSSQMGASQAMVTHRLYEPKRINREQGLGYWHVVSPTCRQSSTQCLHRPHHRPSPGSRGSWGASTLQRCIQHWSPAPQDCPQQQCPTATLRHADPIRKWFFGVRHSEVIFEGSDWLLKHVSNCRSWQLC